MMITPINSAIQITNQKMFQKVFHMFLCQKYRQHQCHKHHYQHHGPICVFVSLVIHLFDTLNKLMAFLMSTTQPS